MNTKNLKKTEQKTTEKKASSSKTSIVNEWMKK